MGKPLISGSVTRPFYKFGGTKFGTKFPDDLYAVDLYA
jgi:hypothetical protein